MTVNENQGNPYQIDLNYRGFVASPVLQDTLGMSVYLDGIRANRPFGDTINWDMIPKSALSSLDLIPGSNPLFGLNTLGGALSLRTKNGFDDAGGGIEASGGSFGRRNLDLLWRAHRPVGVVRRRQPFRRGRVARSFQIERPPVFGKLSHRSANLDADLSLIHARSDLIGNSVTPESMLRERWRQVFTSPIAPATTSPR